MALAELHARLRFAEGRGHRKTWRRWWITAAAVNIRLAALGRKMGDPPGEHARLMNHAAADRRLAAAYPRRLSCR